MKRYRWANRSALVAVLLMVVGCGGEELHQCGHGTQASGDECVAIFDHPDLDDARRLADLADLDESEGTELVTPEEGEKFVFTGKIDDPETIGGQQDISSFSFHGEAGQWFSIKVLSLGLPGPGFFIEGPDNFLRWTPVGVQSSPERQIALSQDGEYTIYIMPALLIQNDAIGPLGDELWNFVGYLERLNPPEPQVLSVDGADIDGELLSLVDGYYEVDGVDEGELIALRAEDLGAHATTTVQLWSNEVTHLASYDVQIGSTTFIEAPAESFLLLVDFETASGPNLDYRFRARGVNSLAADEERVESIALDAGETLIVSHDGLGSTLLRVEIHRDGDDEAVVVEESLSGGGSSAVEYFSLQGGDYEVVVSSEDDEESNLFALFIDVVEAVDLGLLGDGQELEYQRNQGMGGVNADFVAFSLDREIDVSGQVVARYGAGQPDFAIYDIEQIGANMIAPDSGAQRVDFGGVVLAPGDYLARVSASGSGALGAGYELLLNGFERPEGFVASEVINVEENEILRISQSNYLQTPLDLAIDFSGTLIFDLKVIESGSYQRLFFNEPGEVMLTFVEPGGSGELTPDIHIESVETEHLGAIDVGDTLDVDNENGLDFGVSEHFIVEVDTPTRLDGILEPGGEGIVDFLLYRSSDLIEPVYEAEAFESAVTIDTPVVDAGTFVIEINPFGAVPEGYSLSLNAVGP